MAIVIHSGPAAATRPSVQPDDHSCHGPITARGLRAFAAGWRAAADHRRLSRMTETQLGAFDLTRRAIPDELLRRHFAG